MKDATFYRVKARGEFEDKIDTRVERRFVLEIVADSELDNIRTLAEREISEFLGSRFPRRKSRKSADAETSTHLSIRSSGKPNAMHFGSGSPAP